MAIHSLYYLTPSDICSLLHKGQANQLIAALHVFDDLSGSFCCGEITYTIDQDLIVHCKAKGTFSEYKHDAMQWLKTEFYQDATGAICWVTEQYNALGS